MPVWIVSPVDEALRPAGVEWGIAVGWIVVEPGLAGADRLASVCGGECGLGYHGGSDGGRGGLRELSGWGSGVRVAEADWGIAIGWIVVESGDCGS